MNPAASILMKLTEQINCIARLSAEDRAQLRTGLGRCKPPVVRVAAAVSEAMAMARLIRQRMRDDAGFLGRFSPDLRADLSFYFQELDFNMVATRRTARKDAPTVPTVVEFSPSEEFGSSDQPVAEDELVAEEAAHEQLDEDDSDQGDENAVYSVEDVTAENTEGYTGTEPAIVEPEVDLPEVPDFTDPVEGVNYCNHLLSGLLLKLMSSSPNSRLKRSVCSLMGEAAGNQWLAEAAHLSEQRQAFCTEIVNQTMKGSLGMR